MRQDEPRRGECLDQVPEELCGGHLAGLLDKPDLGEPAGPVDGDEAIELAFSRSHLGDTDVDVPDRRALELRALRPVAVHLRQPADSFAIVARTNGAYADRDMAHRWNSRCSVERDRCENAGLQRV